MIRQGKRRAKTYSHCTRCGAVKVYPSTKYLPRFAYERDPYCSTTCAKADAIQERA